MTSAGRLGRPALFCTRCARNLDPLYMRKPARHLVHVLELDRATLKRPRVRAANPNMTVRTHEVYPKSRLHSRFAQLGSLVGDCALTGSIGDIVMPGKTPL